MSDGAVDSDWTAEEGAGARGRLLVEGTQAPLCDGSLTGAQVVQKGVWKHRSHMRSGGWRRGRLQAAAPPGHLHAAATCTEASSG